MTKNYRMTAAPISGKMVMVEIYESTQSREKRIGTAVMPSSSWNNEAELGNILKRTIEMVSRGDQCTVVDQLELPKSYQYEKANN